MSCGIGSPKQLFRVVTNAEGTLAPYRAPDPRGGRGRYSDFATSDGMAAFMKLASLLSWKGLPSRVI